MQATERQLTSDELVREANIEIDLAHKQTREFADRIARLQKEIRAIELAVDGLNIKGFTPRPAEKAALERIKAHCRAALSE